MELANLKSFQEANRLVYEHDASFPKNHPVTEALRASVRPVLTYSFFMLFAFIKLVAVYELTLKGISVEDLSKIWDAETETLFSAIISFWFGQRTMCKMRYKSHVN